ncbi:MAG TPA: adenylyltransferase/cytidyltransferase family protein [Patescibacteria group bacterium]|jgi:cytidyltransferase-like protein|nr:adenylyltransferase/cytidyltransferase family protein [Patescibacteria group bacterium]
MNVQDFGAKIVTFEELDALRPHLGKIVATSGGFDPIHPGHISCIMQSRRYGDTVVVIVNGDAFLKNKKGKPFQNLATRMLIVSALRGVDYVVPFEIENDQTVSKALEQLRPNVFTKGGDRIDEHSIPEWATCQKYNIKVVSGVGLDKLWSSSDFLKEWEEHARLRDS